MRKYLLLAAAMGILGLSCCKSCVDCTKPGYGTITVCKKDYPMGQRTYKETILEIERDGAACN
ncbi:MAG: hypothetical protein U0T73_05905 [Chitinophagales bacterium]